MELLLSGRERGQSGTGELQAMTDPLYPSRPDSAAGVQGPRPTDEKRRWPRAAVDLLVQLKFVSVQEFLDATAEDLSVGGMFLRSQHFGTGGRLRELGELIELQFDAGSRRVVTGVGRVVRVIAPGNDSELVPGVGIEFVELDDTSRRLIAAIVDIKLARPYGG
jgi:PilZ domain